MRVALDGTPLIEPTGGIPRYVSSLLRALRENFPEDEYLLVSDQPVPGALPGERGSRFWERKWWSLGLPRTLAELSVDVFHGADFSVPYLPLCPAVMTLHDLSPWLDPGWHNAAGRVRSRTPLLLRLGLAHLVITPTEAVRNDAVRVFGLSPSRVVAIPHAAGEEFSPQPRIPGAPPYFLIVGTMEPRKNLPLVIDVWRELRRHREVGLTLVGRRRGDFPPLPPEPGLRVFEGAGDAELPGLYSGCVACLYPSYYEGFGLPVLEAMQCGSPVVASCDGALMEVSGGAAMHVEAGDRKGWLEAMRAVLDHPELRETMKERSLARAASFSWRRTAALTRKVYKMARGRFAV